MKIEHPKLPVEFKTAWTKALKSGDFTQGINNLYNRTNDSYCCLGVACIVAGIDKRVIDLCGTIGNSETFLDIDLSGVPMYIKGSNPLVRYLTKMNDIQRRTFDEIADWIDQNL